MDDFIALVLAVIDTFKKRGQGDESPAAKALRDALTERVTPPGPAAARGSATRPAPVTPPALDAIAARRLAQVRASSAAGAGPVVSDAPTAISASAAGANPAGEARLVTALFANPRSLVAAFIAAEVLAKPVALRDP